jgi:hypothetical protein
MDNVSERQSDFGRELARKCDLAAVAFGKRSKRRELIKNISNASELLFALIALVSNVPFAKSLAGSYASDIIGIVSCALLIGAVLVDRVFSKDPPERLQDYALYMRLFSNKILLNMSGPATQQSRAELGVFMEIAADNLADIGSKWPDIIEYVTLHLTESKTAA